MTHESLRAQVALVMQDDLMFTDTVANNIGCGDPEYTLPQIIEAAKLAHAHQFIERLPYGYETLIGDGGALLRPGERFRIALARALLRDPSLLVIEEPVGPIDEDTLALLDDTLARVRPGGRSSSWPTGCRRSRRDRFPAEERAHRGVRYARRPVARQRAVPAAQFQSR